MSPTPAAPTSYLVIPVPPPSVVQPETRLVRYWRPERVLAPPEAVRPDAAEMAAVDEFVPLIDAANQFIDAKHATRTRRAYALEYAAFEKWVTAKNKHLPPNKRLSAMPAHPATLALFLTHIATTPTRDRHGRVRNARGRSPKGIRVAVAAIANEHRLNKKQSPHTHSDVEDLLVGIDRTWAAPLPVDELPKPGTRVGPCTSCAHAPCKNTRARALHVCVYCRQPIGYARRFYVVRADRLVHAACHDGLPPPQKVPLLAAHVRAMVAAQPSRLLGIRNKALLLVQWAGALRRSELSALERGAWRYSFREWRGVVRSRG